MVRDLDPLGPDLDIHHPADQPAGNRIHVLSHVDRAALTNAKTLEHLIRIQPMVGQAAQMLLLPFEQRPAMVVRFRDEFFEKAHILFAAGKIPAASKQKRLVDAVLQVPMQGFHIAVLIRAADIGSLRLAAVVIHQRLVALGVRLAIRMVLDRRA